MTVVMTVVIVMTMGWVSNYDCSHSHDYELELPVMTVVKVMTSSSSQFDCPAVINSKKKKLYVIKDILKKLPENVRSWLIRRYPSGTNNFCGQSDIIQ